MEERRWWRRRRRERGEGEGGGEEEEGGEGAEGEGEGGAEEAEEHGRRGENPKKLYSKGFVQCLLFKSTQLLIRQACSSSIRYLSKSTKKNTNTGTAMLSTSECSF